LTAGTRGDGALQSARGDANDGVAQVLAGDGIDDRAADTALALVCRGHWQRTWLRLLRHRRDCCRKDGGHRPCQQSPSGLGPSWILHRAPSSINAAPDYVSATKNEDIRVDPSSRVDSGCGAAGDIVRLPPHRRGNVYTA